MVINRFCNIYLVHIGPVKTKDMQTYLPLRIGHLDIKDAQCAKKNDGHKISYHIISRYRAMGVLKRRFGHRQIQLSSKVAKFVG